MKGVSRVLFVCVENAGRSQMAEGFARQRGMSALSAGTIPASTIDPVVVQAMKEKGIDISARRPKMLTAQMIDEADIIVAMGCSIEEACPAPIIAQMRRKLVDWDLDDPKGQSIGRVREIRDEIERKVAELDTR